MAITRSKRGCRHRGGGDDGLKSNTQVGFVEWFAETQGLNDVGFIPGTDLKEDQCSRAEYVAFWGEKNRNDGGRYKKNVSPCMVRRIRHLYQRVFQRPTGSLRERFACGTQRVPY